MAFLIVANWKSNGSYQLIDLLLKTLFALQQEKNDISSKIELIVCPPCVYIEYFRSQILEYNLSWVKIGAQNLNIVSHSITGEVKGDMLKEVGAQYVILNHFERVNFFHETKEEVKDKIDIAIDNSLVPIICIGEDKNIYDQQNSLIYCQNILNYLLSSFSLKTAIIAYEPYFAIGKTEPAPINHIIKITQFIDKNFHNKVLYGGAVVESFAQKLFQNKLSGLMLGRASIDIDKLKCIITMILDQ